MGHRYRTDPRVATGETLVAGTAYAVGYLSPLKRGEGALTDLDPPPVQWQHRHHDHHRLDIRPLRPAPRHIAGHRADATRRLHVLGRRRVWQDAGRDGASRPVPDAARRRDR